MRSRTRMLAVLLAVSAAVALVAAGCGGGGGGGGNNTTTAPKVNYKAALISDVVGFNDSGFNKLQLEGLKKAAKKIGGTAIPLVSHSQSDYQPNYTTAVHDGAKIIVAAGYLLGDTMKAFAKQYPNVKFAITDDPVAAVGGLKNEEGINYATEQGGCLVGILAAKMAQSMGKEIIGVAGGQQIPPVDTYIAGYKFCATKVVPGTKVLVQYSNDFADVSKCSAIAQNEIGQGAEVIFQVAGPCGDGALKEASTLGKWGIGVDADEYNVAKRILTSALKQTGVGVYDTVVSAAQGNFKGGGDLFFTLKNGGIGVGKISPQVKPAWITLMNQYKAKIIKGTLKIPTTIPKG